MKLEYVNLETKRRSVCQIQNNCKVYITEYKENSDEVEKDEEYISDEYELASLFSNIQDVLRSDRYDKEVPDLPGFIDVRFILVYSVSGHNELCSPLLTDGHGVSVLSLIEGFLAFIKKEHTYYNWCNVVFNDDSENGYSYFCDDDSIGIGDKVIVPVGPKNRETVGRVVNRWRLSEERLPYPAEKTKKIIRKLREKIFNLDEFIKEANYSKNYIITDVDGVKYKAHIYGDYLNDEDSGPKPNEPYIKCILVEGGIVVKFVQSRISNIEIDKKKINKKIVQKRLKRLRKIFGQGKAK